MKAVPSITTTGSEKPLTEKQAAPELGASVSKLRSDRFYGRGCPYVRNGRKILYLPSDIRAYLQQNRIDPASR